jgi:DNA-binding CsgD family transcriptional regulator
MSAMPAPAPWTDDAARAHAFRDLVLAISDPDSETAAAEAAARPIAVGLGAAVVIGLLDTARDVVHALGVHDPLPHRAHVIDGLFQAPLERRGYIARALDDGGTVLAEVDADYMQETWSDYAAAAREFRLRSIAIASFNTRGGVSGIIWAGRADDEPAFTETDSAFLGDAGAAVALGVHAGSLQEALERAAGRRAAVVDQPLPPGRQERRRETLLSERERDILREIAAGRTNREAADELALSVRTVEWHRARIQWKLGVSGRADLTQAAREQGV